MAFQFHLDRPKRKIMVHKVGCGQWKKHIGTSFHKHGNSNSFYLEQKDLPIVDLSVAKEIGLSISKSERFSYHECSFCCRG